MALIQRGLSLIVYNGIDITLTQEVWNNSITAIYRINSSRDGWNSYQPGIESIFQGFETLNRDTFYLLQAYRDFDLPDAQTLACATGESSAVITAGLSLFVYGGEALTLAGQSWLNQVTTIYKINDFRDGWNSYEPGIESIFQGFETLENGTFYFAQTTGSFELPGAQVVGCAETFGRERFDGTLFVKYLDLLNELPVDPTPLDLKTAPNIDLFRRSMQELTIGEHNHDDRYYQKPETLSKVEIYALFQGVDEVIPLPTFANFPQPGIESKLYIDEQYNVGYRWTSTTYIAVSSPGVDLTPYLTRNEATNSYQLKGNYITVEAANNSFQAKGNYIKSVSFNNFLYLPDINGRVSLFFVYDLIAALKAFPGYVANVEQTLRHDTNGIIRWGAGTVVIPVKTRGYVTAGYVNNLYVN